MSTAARARFPEEAQMNNDDFARRVGTALRFAGRDLTATGILEEIMAA